MVDQLQTLHRILGPGETLARKWVTVCLLAYLRIRKKNVVERVRSFMLVLRLWCCLQFKKFVLFTLCKQ